MNRLLDTYVAVEGLDKAMRLAKNLIEADKQVMVQLDDCNIYIVAYADNDDRLGDKRFAAITTEEEEKLAYSREDEKLAEARKIVEEADGEDNHIDDEDDDDYDDYDDDYSNYDDDTFNEDEDEDEDEDDVNW